MNKNNMIIVGVVLAVALGGFFALGGFSEDNSTDNSATSTSIAAEDSTPAPDPATKTTEEDTGDQPQVIVSKGEFLDYTKADFDKATDNKRVLFFHAATCVVCKQIESNMAAANMPDGVSLFVVRMEQHDDLISKYGVNRQSTFVQVDESGNEVKNWNWLSRPFAGADDLANEVV